MEWRTRTNQGVNVKHWRSYKRAHIGHTNNACSSKYRPYMRWPFDLANPKRIHGWYDIPAAAIIQYTKHSYDRHINTGHTRATQSSTRTLTRVIPIHTLEPKLEHAQNDITYTQWNANTHTQHRFHHTIKCRTIFLLSFSTNKIFVYVLYLYGLNFFKSCCFSSSLLGNTITTDKFAFRYYLVLMTLNAFVDTSRSTKLFE